MAEQIDRAQWAPFLDAITNSLIGKQAEIEVVSLDLGDQIEAEWAPLIGITYDHKNDLIEIALDDMDHLIRSPRSAVPDDPDWLTDVVAAIEIVDGDGNRQIVKFKDPLALPAPAEDAGMAAR